MYWLHSSTLVRVLHGQLDPDALSLIQEILCLEKSSFAILGILNDLREQRKLSSFPRSPWLPLSSPRTVSCTELFFLTLFSSTHLLLKEIHLLHTYFIFLGCFYTLFFIIGMVSLFPSVSFSVLSLTFFSFPFFIPQSLCTATSWLLKSQAKSRGCRNYPRDNPMSHKSGCKL